MNQILETLTKLKPEFRLKVMKVLSLEVQVKLLQEKASTDLYPNKYMELIDALMIGLGHFNQNKNPCYDTEKALYEQLEPYIDDILKDC